jgi:hypothetical protein
VGANKDRINMAETHYVARHTAQVILNPTCHDFSGLPEALRERLRCLSKAYLDTLKRRDKAERRLHKATAQIEKAFNDIDFDDGR